MDSLKNTPGSPVPQPTTETLVPTPGQPVPNPFGHPERIGRYRVLRLLGEGGFGRVYLALDQILDRQVAIKVPRADRISRPEDVESYLTEARVLTRLEHPGIVPVYDADRTDDGFCFVVSKYIKGHDLAHTIKSARPSHPKAAELVAAVAEALHYAHTRGLVHRDIKPANILIDAAGKPYVADFGLALKDEDYGKGTGYAGTPAYMSPEQARGEGHRVDGRSDIFGLGVVFFELLTGRRPFRADTQRDLLDEVAKAEARPPRQIDDTIPKELERICQKALSKRASERYNTARDMADDLRHWLRSLSEGRNPAEVGWGVADRGEPEWTAAPDLGKDAFLSYASSDQEVAFRLCGHLEEQGVHCWIAPRDVPPGGDYGAAIIRAIEGTKVTLLLLSAHANASIHVTHEVERATSKRKRVIPVRLMDVQPSPSLELHLATAQWVDAWRLTPAQVATQLALAVRSEGSQPPPPTPLPTQPVTPAVGSDSDNRPIKIVPKGLRSFDAHDADFFLELLPGPRDRDGLPDSIRFWKRTIEQSDPDLTFKVGLIYGPSGCGKSSLVKAGLLPRLAHQVLSVYVEATPEETESRLLKGLRKACPDLPTQLGLVDSLMAIRQGRVLRPGQKVLIVLDQFEQWLHARRGQVNTELVAALRQCDGEHVQAVVMVRDDFWLAATRFMDELEIELLKGQNTALVDLFDLRHARKVLIAFGTAYGNMPERTGDISRDQNAFLDQATSELAQDGKVISVRLALFAEMVKGKPWTLATLKDVGGTEGVGITFLEETFSSPQANPKHRLHQKAAQAVLKALLPESGTDIKGQMRSEQELQEASGYAGRSREFTDLIKILDGELRLITPTDPEGIDSEDANRPMKGEKYYQLTHDYLVHSLREWLTRKQRETRRGRAELRLAERSALWNAKPENRFLPSVSEWIRIRALTKKKDWTEPQRKMMWKAGRVHEMRGLGTAALVAVLIALGLNIRERVAESNRATIANGLVNQVLKANTAQVPGIVALMKDYRRWVDPTLKEALGKAGKGSPEELHARLALLPVDAAQVEPLHDRMLVSGPEVATVLRQSLEPHRASLTPKLWSAVEKAGPGENLILPAASALALYDPKSPSWDGSGDKVASALVRINPILLGGWIEALRPVGPRLTIPLAAIFRDRQRPETERSVATTILADYAKDDGGLLAGLLMDAEPPAYATLFPVAERLKPEEVPLFQAEIKKSPRSDWQDAPLNPSWTAPDLSLVRRVEAAEGSVSERFAYCLTMPLDEFVTTAEGLKKSGYRPTRFRPFADGTEVRVASVWVRDGRDWHLSSGLSAAQTRRQDRMYQAEGSIPVDVAGYVTAGTNGKPSDRYAALWVKKVHPDEKSRAYVGIEPSQHQIVQDELKKEGLGPTSLQAVLGPDDTVRYSGVWGESPTVWNVSWDQTEATLGTKIASHTDTVLGDVTPSAPAVPLSSRERTRLALEAAEQGLKEKPEDLGVRFARAQAFSNVGEWQKALDDLNALVEKAPKALILYRHRSLTHAHLKHKDEALGDLAKYREGDGSESGKLYLSVVVAAEVGEGEAQAIEALEDAVTRHSEDKGLIYDASCAYSLASVSMSARDKTRGRGYADKAVALLARAIHQGYSDYAHILEDTDLDPIRDHPGFAEAVRPGHLDRRYAAVWSQAPGREAVPVYGLDPSAQRKRCLDLKAAGYRPVSMSAVRTTPEGSLITASVWQRPVISEEQKDRLAERQARAAVALVRMGKADAVWPLLKHSADPRLRSFIVNWLNPLGADPKSVATGLEHIDPSLKPTPAEGQTKMDAILFHPETSMRRALILSLGTYGTEGLSSDEREPPTVKLLDLYRTDPDAGVHGAAEWTLRQWKQAEALKKVDAELIKLKDWGDRRWFVNKLGQTFAVIDGPVEFVMGSPGSEPDRDSDETAHRVRIPRRFAIATKEVTVEQYQRFVTENPKVDHANNDKYSPEPTGPMNGVTWYHAAAYCDWLSKQEHLEPCYEPNVGGEYAEGMKPVPDFLNRTGYRLPTEAEWEYACRSGAMTSRYYGGSVQLLGKYARYIENSQDHAWTCGQLQPNDLGLYDMLGNVYEWCEDQAVSYPKGDGNSIAEDMIKSSSIIDKNPRLLRGGSFVYQPADVRSASRFRLLPSNRNSSFGFRPSRTYP